MDRNVRNVHISAFTSLFVFSSSQPIFTMSAQQKQLQNVTKVEFEAFMKRYFNNDVSVLPLWVLCCVMRDIFLGCKLKNNVIKALWLCVEGNKIST